MTYKSIHSCGRQDSVTNVPDPVSIHLMNAGDRIRTCERTRRLGPEPSPFDHSGTPAKMMS